MQGSIPSKATISKRVSDELKEFAVTTVYLYICFTAILYLKASILKAHNIEFAPWASLPSRPSSVPSSHLLGTSFTSGSGSNPCHSSGRRCTVGRLSRPISYP